MNGIDARSKSFGWIPRSAVLPPYRQHDAQATDTRNHARASTLKLYRPLILFAFAVCAFALVSPIAQWGGEGLVGRPSTVQTHLSSSIGKIENLTPFRQTALFSTKRQHPVIAAISHLRDLVGPADVADYIALIVADSIQSRTGRRISDVGIKRLEVSQLSRNSTSRVFLVVMPLGVVASSDHGAPMLIDFGFGHAVSPISLRAGAGMIAPARFYGPPPKQFCGGDLEFSAFADALPVPSVVRRSRGSDLPDYGEQSEFGSREDL